MADDLQIELLAKLGNVLSAFDKVQGKIKDVEREQAKANKTAADMQKKITEGFNTTDVEKFEKSMRGAHRTTADFQNQAGEGMVHLKDKFHAFHGVALKVGGAATLALAGIAEAARLVGDKIDEAIKKAAQLGETSGDKHTKAALALAATPGITDPKALVNLTNSASGTATQDQINDFVTKLADTSHQEDEADKRAAEQEAVNDAQDAKEREKAKHEGRTFVPTPRKPKRRRNFFLNDQTATSAVDAFAELGALPGADAEIIRSLKETGSTTQALETLRGQLDAAEAADPDGVQVLRENRNLELRDQKAGSSHTARVQALAARARKTREGERAVKTAGKGTAGRVNDAIIGDEGLVTDIFDVLTPGTREGRSSEAFAKERLDRTPPPPIKVEVINQPAAPVDAGY
jgi:hypothetical protein